MANQYKKYMEVPTASMTITDTVQKDVTNYATAQVVDSNLLAGNIKKDTTILGVTGTYEGGTATAQAKTATPTTSSQTILPDSGYDYLSQVTINAIPYVETLNASGGYTATIAG